MGYEIDSILTEVRLPQDKLDKRTEAISSLLEGSKTTLLKLQSVIGLLTFACAVVVPGRAFLRCLTDLMVGVRKPHYHIRITGEVKQDLHVWLNFLSTYNGKSMFLSEMFLDPEVLHIYTDVAKNVGFAAVFKTHWFWGTWPSWCSEQNITLLELMPILLALETWGYKMKNSVVVLYTDNEALLSVINKQSSKEKLVMVLVRRLVILVHRWKSSEHCIHKQTPGHLHSQSCPQHWPDEGRTSTAKPGIGAEHPSSIQASLGVVRGVCTFTKYSGCNSSYWTVSLPFYSVHEETAVCSSHHNFLCLGNWLCTQTGWHKWSSKLLLR